MKVKTVTVSEKGQIAIPVEVRKEIGIHKGDEMMLMQIDNKLLLQPAAKIAVKLRDEFKDILKFSEKSLKEVWSNKADNIWSKYLK